MVEGDRRRLDAGEVDRGPAALGTGDVAAVDLEVTTEFLVIAATLVDLKARRLLPGPVDVEVDDELALFEQRDLLLARLIEAKTFRDAGKLLKAA